jgi:hypothetical protein
MLLGTSFELERQTRYHEPLAFAKHPSATHRLQAKRLHRQGFGDAARKQLQIHSSEL